MKLAAPFPRRQALKTENRPASVLRRIRNDIRKGSTKRRQLTAVVASCAFLLAPVGPAMTPKGEIQHVIYIQFDNVHLRRDNPNVPSDLEQMPHLLNFFENNGTLLSNHHTPLIAHAADDILTSLTGVYPERHGQAVSNSFNYFNPNSSDGLGSTFTTSFTYWTDTVDPSTPSADPSFSLLTPAGKNAPAPWVPFTRSDCKCWGGVHREHGTGEHGQ